MRRFAEKSADDILSPYVPRIISMRRGVTINARNRSKSSAGRYASHNRAKAHLSMRHRAASISGQCSSADSIMARNNHRRNSWARINNILKSSAAIPVRATSRNPALATGASGMQSRARFALPPFTPAAESRQPVGVIHESLAPISWRNGLIVAFAAGEPSRHHRMFS